MLHLPRIVSRHHRARTRMRNSAKEISGGGRGRRRRRSASKPAVSNGRSEEARLWSSYKSRAILIQLDSKGERMASNGFMSVKCQERFESRVAAPRASTVVKLLSVLRMGLLPPPPPPRRTLVLRQISPSLFSARDSASQQPSLGSSPSPRELPMPCKAWLRKRRTLNRTRASAMLSDSGACVHSRRGLHSIHIAVQHIPVRCGAMQMRRRRRRRSRAVVRGDGGSFFAVEQTTPEPWLHPSILHPSRSRPPQPAVRQTCSLARSRRLSCCGRRCDK